MRNFRFAILALVAGAFALVGSTLHAEQFSNFALTTLSQSVGPSDTALTVSSTANFPGSAPFRLLIQDAQAAVPEIVMVTAITGNTYTVTRAIEGTTATGHSSGAQVAQFVTAGVITDIYSKLGTATPAGATGQIQYNNNGSLGAFTANGDCVITSLTGAIICTKTNGNAFVASATTDTTNAANISSGTLPAARLPAPGTSTLGGILSLASATAHQVVSYINASGQQILVQLGFGDLTGSVSTSQLPALTGDTTSSAGSAATTTAKVNGVAYPTAPALNTVPIVTGTNQVTYQTNPASAGGTGATSLGQSVNNNNGIFNTNQTSISPDSTYNSIAPTYTTSFMSGVPADWTFTRSGNAWSFNQAGVLVVSATNVGRVDYDPLTHVKLGLYNEPAATNYAIYSEDLTNAAWTKTNATVALNATSIQGVVNAASTVTATAANATVTQAITLSSNWNLGSVFLKCVTCTGAISVTEDGGTTWTAFYPPFNAWKRFAIGGQTLTNPTIGIKIANSGDVVQVDNFQQEINYTTSPIPTAATTVTRNAESLYLTNFASLGFNPAGGSFVLEAQGSAVQNVIVNSGLVMFTNSIDSYYIDTEFNNGIHAHIQNSSNFYGNGTAGGAPTGVFRSGMSYQSGNNFASYAQGDTLATVNDTSSGMTSANVPAAGLINLLYIGSLHGATGTQIDGYVRGFSYWNSPLTQSVENQQVSFPNVTSTCVQPMNWPVTAVNKCQRLQPGATDCQNAMVNNVVPSDAVAPITISTGGTYSGHYNSTSGSTAPITVTTASPVIIEDSILTAPSGQLIAYTGPGAPNISVLNTTGFSNAPSTYPAVLSFGASATLTMINDRFSNVSGIFVNGASAAYVYIDHTILYNINGTGAQHAIQVGNAGVSAVALTGGITNNVIINAPYKSNVNDVINIYNGAGTSTALFPITGNWIAGLYSTSPLTTGNSGCGIIADNLSQYLNITYNAVIDTGNGGICVDTPATHNNIVNNTLVSSGVINGNGAVTAQNVGLYINGDTTNYAAGNFAYWMKATSTPISTVFQSTNDYYFPNSNWSYSQNYGLESAIPNPNYLPSAIALEQKYVMPPSSCY